MLKPKVKRKVKKRRIKVSVNAEFKRLAAEREDWKIETGCSHTRILQCLGADKGFKEI